jgi:hypothetical protein
MDEVIKLLQLGKISKDNMSNVVIAASELLEQRRAKQTINK